MSKDCQVCGDNRIYLDAVLMCPGCGELLHPWDECTRQPEHAITEIDLQVNTQDRGPVGRPERDLLPWLVGALVILVLAAVLVRSQT